jgi:PII-like signaling protein
VQAPLDGKLLRIYIGDHDRWHGRPLYEAVVEQARRDGLAGATVFRGVLGYGASSRLHSAKFLELSTDLPVMIEIVDVAERIDAFLPKIHEMVTEGLVTIERVEVLAYRGRSGPR